MCNHLDKNGIDLAQLVVTGTDDEGREEVIWECAGCGEELDEDQQLILDLPDARQAHAEATEVMDEQVAYYESTR